MEFYGFPQLMDFLDVKSLFKRLMCIFIVAIDDNDACILFKFK